MTGGAPEARRLASAILAEPRFHAPRVPRPLHGALHSLGSVLDAPLRALGDLITALGTIFPGGVAAVWIALALLAVGGGILLARRYIRSTPAAPRANGAALEESPDTPTDLLAAAQRAERAGRLDEAVRLRFRAGLLALAQRGAVEDVACAPNGQLAAALHSDRFRRLAGRFDEIAYGGAAAAQDDVEAARREWPALLREQRS
jgi:hypothetical protein